MTETPPPRRALATFLRGPARDAQARAGEEPEAPTPPTAAEAEAGAPAAPHITPPAAGDASDPAATATAEADAGANTETPPQRPGEATLAPTANTGDATTAAAATVASTPWPVADLPVARSGAAAAAAPTFARPRTRARAPRVPAWQWALLLALGVLLALQILLADRERLAGDARWRPVLTALCGVLRCELPVWHEPGAFTMLDRDVRPAPGETGVLRIQASFRNDARWSQAWPWLQLSLSDADGRVIGTRVFAPAEYLGHAPDPAQTLAPGQSGRIDFRVREPAAGTAAFTFDFH